MRNQGQLDGMRCIDGHNPRAVWKVGQRVDLVVAGFELISERPIENNGRA
jgi:hypothetical protein